MSVVEFGQVVDAQGGDLFLGHVSFEVFPEPGHAVFAEAGRAPGDCPGRARIVVDVQSIDGGLHHLKDAMVEVLAIQGAIGAEPPRRLSLVLVVPEPGDDEGLAGEIAAGGLEEIRGEVDHLRRLGAKSDRRREEADTLGVSVFDAFGVRRACPTHGRAAVGLVELGIVVHEDDVGAAEGRPFGSLQGQCGGQSEEQHGESCAGHTRLLQPFGRKTESERPWRGHCLAAAAWRALASTLSIVTGAPPGACSRRPPP